MSGVSKRFTKALSLVEKSKLYSVEEGVSLCLRLANDDVPVKFIETVEVAVRLGVDPRHADQMVRGTVNMPHGTGKKVRVLVFTKDKKDEAYEAGADIVDDGTGPAIDAIKAGDIQFDACIASPDMMPILVRVARELGPRGLMPNPKLGTVTVDIGTAVKEVKGGRVTFRVEKGGIVHVPIGKVNFSQFALMENLSSLLGALVRAKPSGAKGLYMRSAVLSTTMGPGVKIDLASINLS